MTFFKLVVACAVMFVSATLHGTVGFGLGLISVPFLVLIDPVLVPGPVLMSSFVLTILMAYRERWAMDVSGIKLGLVGRILGTLVAALMLANMPSTKGMTITLGALVIAAVVISGSGWRVHPTRWTLVGAGVLSGFMGTIASIGGPPMALLYQDASGERLRSTMSGFFIFGTLISLVGLISAGRFGLSECRFAMALVPGVLGGFALSGRTILFLNHGYTRTAVLTVSALSGIGVILRGIL